MQAKKKGILTPETAQTAQQCLDHPRMDVSSSSVALAGIPFSASIFRIDRSCVLHPFTLHKLDAGPIQLMTIAHAFNYRMAVLRDGVRSAVRIRTFTES